MTSNPGSLLSARTLRHYDTMHPSQNNFWVKSEENTSFFPILYPLADQKPEVTTCACILVKPLSKPDEGAS